MIDDSVVSIAQLFAQLRRVQSCQQIPARCDRVGECRSSAWISSTFMKGSRLAFRDRVCKLLHMATNLAIDDKLLDEALRIGGQRTKKDTVTQALQEYVERRKQARILELFGKVEFDSKYDYKRQRRRS